MGWQEHALSDVNRVIKNYNRIVRTSSIYHESDEIEVLSSPDDEDQYTNNVLLTMQEKILELRKADEDELADEVNSYVIQIHNRRENL